MAIPAIKSQIVEPKVTHITWVDGTKGTLIGSNTAKLRDALYLKNVKPVVVDPPVIVPPVGVIWETVGEGKGQLNLGDISNRNIKIKPGQYEFIAFKGNNCKVNGDGSAFNNSGALSIGTSKNLEVFGFKWNSHNYRAVSIVGLVQDFHFHHNYLKDVQNCTITNEVNLIYDGTPNTIASNWRIEDNEFINCNALLNMNGSCEENGTLRGLSSGLKFLRNKASGCDWGTVVSAGACEDYEIAYNKITDQNLEGLTEWQHGNHNGIFAMVGCGTIHHNKITYAQGNLTRAWGVSFLGGQKKKIKIHDNIMFDTFKYGAFEVQMPPYLANFLKNQKINATVCDYDVISNTAGRLNTIKDWDGGLCDVYTTGAAVNQNGKLVNVVSNVLVDKNLGFEMNFSDISRNPADFAMLNQMHDRALTNVTIGQNKYCKTSKEAVADLLNFKSLHLGFGAEQ